MQKLPNQIPLQPVLNRYRGGFTPELDSMQWYNANGQRSNAGSYTMGYQPMQQPQQQMNAQVIPNDPSMGQQMDPGRLPNMQPPMGYGSAPMGGPRGLLSNPPRRAGGYGAGVPRGSGIGLQEVNNRLSQFGTNPNISPQDQQRLLTRQRFLQRQQGGVPKNYGADTGPLYQPGVSPTGPRRMA